MSIRELIYWIFNTPYYRIKIVKDMEVLYTLVVSILHKTDNNLSDFVVSRKYHKAWLALTSHCFRDGKAYECYADLDNAIPLIEETKLKSTKEYFNGILSKEVSITEVKSNIAINFNRDIKVKKMREIQISPEFVFKMIEQKIVKEILTEDKQGLPLWIVLLLLGVLILVVLYFTVFKGMAGI